MTSNPIVAFDPQKPTCVECNSPLGNPIRTVIYPDKHCMLRICECENCGAQIGYVVMDNPALNVDYVLRDIPEIAK